MRRPGPEDYLAVTPARMPHFDAPAFRAKAGNGHTITEPDDFWNSRISVASVDAAEEEKPSWN
jgi:hypothetical protein